MTYQACEILEYRDEVYQLFEEPLNPYLEQNKQLKFEDYTTAHHRGYQGYWLLQSDCLYLTNIESSNQSMKSIFGSEDPVLAEWYSGSLEFGIENFTSVGLEHSFDNYLWLNIKNGKVVDKKIIKRFKQEIEIKFGKYKGNKFEEVLNGKIQRTEATVKEYISCLIDFLIDKEYNLNIQCPYFAATKQDVLVIKEIHNFRIKYLLTRNFLAVSSLDTRLESFSLNDGSDPGIFLSKLLEKILSSDFTRPITVSKENLDNAAIAEQSLLLNGDIEYLNWALKNVEFFAIPPCQIDKEFSLKRLKTLSINRLNNFVFEFEPVLESIKYKFSEDIKTINREKFEKFHKVIYDHENQFYTPNLTKKDLIKGFGHYLDEDYLPNEEEEVFHESYGQYEGTYAQDIEGLSDDFINDVLGGEPEAYWNID